jgi:anti-anti-sigma regulatory factor
LDIVGSVTGTWALQLEDQLTELGNTGEHYVILNFKDVPSIDILGIRAIQCGLNSGLNMKAMLLNSDCREVFTRGGLSDVVDICFAEDDALKRFHRNAAVNQALSEKRQCQRIDTDYPGEIVLPNHRFRGIMKNLSKGGALLAHLDPIEIPISGEVRFLFRLRLIGDQEVVGNLVRPPQKINDWNTLGVRFSHNEMSRRLVDRIVDDPTSAPPAQE